jgi:uncharacterized membrane protein YjjP (DUF1212 family)
VTENPSVHRTLDLALRVGEMLLSNGAGAADVTATMSSITHHLGLRAVYVDVTFTKLEVSYQPSFDQPAHSLIRHVTHRETDFDDLTRVDHIVTDLLLDRIDVDEARARVASVVSTGHQTPRWAVNAGWAGIGAGIAFLFGGGPVVALIAAISSSAIEVVQRHLARLRLPFFYSQAAGGLLATLIAVGTQAAGVDVDPSLVITSGIVTLLAGLGFIGAIQDALTGFYVTATARLLEVMISTAGIIVGVSGGITVGHLLGVDIALDPGRLSLAQIPTMAAGAAVAAAAFAVASYAPKRAVPPIAVISGIATAMYLLVEDHGVGRAWSAALAAVFIGVVSFTASRWCRVPPLVLVVAAIVPLLPGLSIYRALSLLALEDYTGILAMITAVAVAISLAAGVILGEYIAQPVLRDSRRREPRLAGPRLVGPRLTKNLRERRRRRRANKS